ncbi:MAG: hypothetical protein PHU34_10365 [Candidatus Methanoperedens sp.]|nr:hypothetical protein [Candidatus Methanoperedens sp.]
MCIIQIYSDRPNCGEFEYLDEDMWLEANGSYLLNLHMILKVKKNLSKINIVLHGKLQNPINSSFYSESWNISHDKGIIFNNTFLNDEIRENYYEKGYEILGDYQVKIEGILARVLPEENISNIRVCNTDLKECSCIEIDFKEGLVAGETYAMRIGFYIEPPQSKTRYLVNKMRYQIHYYTTLSINSEDAIKINERKNKTIPVNPNESMIFIIPPPNTDIEKPSVTTSYYYEHVWNPLSTDMLKKSRVAYRWKINEIRKSNKLFVTDRSNPLSFTFRRFNPPHYVGYLALFLVLWGYVNKITNDPIYYLIFIIIYGLLFILTNKTFFRGNC